MRLIESIKDVEGIRTGEQYVFVGYPDPPVTEAELEEFDSRFKQAQRLERSIEDAILVEIAKEPDCEKETT